MRSRDGWTVSRAAEVLGLGQILGWWGEIGVIVSLSGLIVGLFSAMDRNGLALLEGQSTTHTVQMRMASRQARMLANQEEMISNQEEMVELLDRIADTLDTRLPEN